MMSVSTRFASRVTMSAPTARPHSCRREATPWCNDSEGRLAQPRSRSPGMFGSTPAKLLKQVDSPSYPRLTAPFQLVRCRVLRRSRAVRLGRKHMPAWGWVLLGIAILVAVVLGVLLVAANRRTAALRSRFGPEYDRTVAATGHKRDAEAELEERQDRHNQFPIRALNPVARQRYQGDWRTRTVTIRRRPHRSGGGSRPAHPIGHARARLPR